jgi:hypothetical protein
MNEATHDHDVVTQQDRMASAVSIDLDTAVAVRGEVEAEIAGVFGRRESRAHAVGYVRALCSGLERKNGWRIAEAAGDARPDGKQRCRCRKPHPCSSGGMFVFVEYSAESITAMDVQMRDLLWICDRLG